MGRPAPLRLPPRMIFLPKSRRRNQTLPHAEIEPHFFQREVKGMLQNIQVRPLTREQRGSHSERKILKLEPVSVCAVFLLRLPQKVTFLGGEVIWTPGKLVLGWHNRFP